MRALPILGALFFLAATSLASAQIETSIQTQRSTFLLYERVDVFVTVRNVGGTDLLLSGTEGHPWLSFMVTSHGRANDFPVERERRINPAPVTLKVGESKTFKVNLTPLFAFRQQGEYRASAVIDLPGEGEIISDPVPFSVLNGRNVWSQVRSVEGVERTYSLIRFSPLLDTTRLYLRVESPDENLVYANIALGDIVAAVDPQAYFDPAGNLHILQPVAMSTYLYTRADQDGKILHQIIFKSAPVPGSGFDLVPPRLTKMDDGNVIVVGGSAEDVDAPQERLSDGQKEKTAAQTAAPPAAAQGTPQ